MYTIKKAFAVFLLVCLTWSLAALDQGIEDRVTQLMSQMSLDEKVAQLHGSAFFNTADNSRLGIPGFYMSDGPHGVRDTPATAFPVGIAMTATWDPDYLEQVGWAMGREFRGAGKNMVLGPCTDIQRDPRNGRSAESCGEEPYLGGKTNAALVRGIQSTHAIATIKHFAATNHQANRSNDNHDMDSRTLHEFYGLPFRMAVQEGDTFSVMCAYNWINGKPSSENYDLLTKVLREDWGYENFVVSDWWSTYTNAANPMNAGLDVEMPDGVKYPAGLKSAVESGQVSQGTLDQAVRRVLRTKIKAGLMDSSTPPGSSSHINSQEHKTINLEAGKKSIVLLKNQNNILPLSKSGTIALIGPNANTLALDGFGSSWVDAAYTVTPREGITRTAPGVNLLYEKGCDINSSDTSGFNAAKNIAAGADVVVFIGGLDRSQEGEGYGERQGKDRESGSVQLPGQQQNLINELAAVNPNVVVVIQSGGICSVNNSINSIKGLIYAWYCGNEGGNAIAQVLFGDYNPGGKLPVTMPKTDSQLPDWSDLNFTNDMIDGIGYRRFDANGQQPLFPFGFGLSYTTFAYSNLSAASSVAGGQNVTVTVDVTNTGNRTGDEVAQLYLTHNSASVPMPVKQLRGFKRITLAPQEKQTVSFTLTPYELAYWSTSRDNYFVESGSYTVKAGGSSADLNLSKNFTVTSDYTIAKGQRYDVMNVNISSPGDGQNIDGTCTIEWSATDPENDPLTYTLEYFSDAWYVLAADITATSYSWDTTTTSDGPYILRITASDGVNTVTDTTGTIRVANTVSSNLALGKTVTTTSSESAELDGSKAVDGNAATRWSSGFSDPQSITVNLGKTCNINRVVLKWEAAYGVEYKILTSTNGVTWNEELHITGGTGGDSEHFITATAQYVKMEGLRRSTQYGYSLFEFEVYGNTPTPPPTPTPIITPTPTQDNRTPTPFIPGPGTIEFVPETQSVMINSSFTTELHVDSGNQRVAAYGLTISFNPNTIAVNTAIGNNGVDPGSDGFVSAVNPNVQGRLTCAGFDINGKGPGNDLHLITIHWNSIGLGTTATGLTVSSLTDPTSTDVGTPAGKAGSITVTDTLKGDVNGDGVVNIIDALITAQAYVGLEPADFNPLPADVNCDGKINIVDALILAQFYVNLITGFC